MLYILNINRNRWFQHDLFDFYVTNMVSLNNLFAVLAQFIKYWLDSKNNELFSQLERNKPREIISVKLLILFLRYSLTTLCTKLGFSAGHWKLQGSRLLFPYTFPHSIFFSRKYWEHPSFSLWFWEKKMMEIDTKRCVLRPNWWFSTLCKTTWKIINL